MSVMNRESSAEPGSFSPRSPSQLLSDSAQDFSLVTGGPVYQLLLRARLVRPPLDRVGWRVVIITAIAWVPLLLLTALSGHVTSGVRVPFLQDFAVQVRFLIALPLCIIAEVTIHSGIRKLVLQFVDRQIIKPAALPLFEDSIASAMLVSTDTSGLGRWT